MKTNKLLLLAGFFLFVTTVFSQTSGSPRKTESVIKSTVECEFCKKAVETNLSKVKGVRSVKADPELRTVTVIYNSKKVTIDEIRNNLAKMGYDADEVKADNRTNRALKHKQATEPETK